MSRYEGQPFRKLLDCYVLSSIGHLDDASEHNLSMMTPKLAETFGISGSWFEIVAAQMGFPPDLPQKILAIWENGKSNAAAQGLSVDPVEFTHQFVDTNFPQ